MVITRVLNFYIFLFNFHQNYDTSWIYYIYIWVSEGDNVILTGAGILVDTCTRVWFFQFDLHFHSKISNQATILSN